MSDDREKILLSPRSLEENGLSPTQATLGNVIDLLNLPSDQRSFKQISILQALTKKISFFLQKIEELGETVHYDSCKFMNYEYVSAGNVIVI